MVGSTNMSREVLSVRGLTKRFGGLVAVDNLDLSVREGQICALIGPNGSGKTTVLNLITGVYKNDHGTVEFVGDHVQNLPPHSICWKGIARTFQNIRILSSQTVFQNALLGKGYGNGGVSILQTALNTRKYREATAACTDEVNGILDFVGLLDMKDEYARNLPYGKQRILEIARALITGPKLLLLDEPAAGLNSQEIHALMELIKRISDRGISILLIEHRMEIVGKLADWVFVLNHGAKIAEGTFDKVKEDPAVIRAYLGRGGR